MDITIFGFKFRLEILVLLVIIYFLLTSHLFCSCSRIGLLEGLDMLSNTSDKIKKHIEEDHKLKKPEPNPVISSISSTNSKKNGESIASNKEGFVGANTNYGQSMPYKLGDYSIVDTSTWGMPDLTVVKGKELSKGVKDILNRPEQPVPLPEGELDFFATTQFKPECCPNTYSTSTGCACMTAPQYNYLITRANNNLPYSEY